MTRSALVLVLLALSAPTPTLANGCAEFAENQWWPIKGGIATIRDGIHVGAGATKTNLIVIQAQDTKRPQPSPEVRWTGKSWDEPEVVVIFERKVLDWSSLPRDFDLSKAIIVSFEPDKVRVFDFAKREGGYYPRSR